MTRTLIKLFVSILLACLPPLCSYFGWLPYSVGAMFSILLLSACFWIFEVIPGHATSLLVIFLEILLFSNPGKWEFLNLVRPINGKPLAPSVFLTAIADSAVILF